MTGTIVSVDAFEVRLPLNQSFRLGEALEIHDREYTIVRISDELGHVGTSYGLSRNLPTSALIRRVIAPRWESRRLEEHERFFSQVIEANPCLGFDGIFARALGLAECALYDLLAIRAGKPLCEFLGGQRRPIPASVVGGYPLPNETPESLFQEVQYLQRYEPVSIKIASCADVRRDAERLEICRNAMPASQALMIDMHWPDGDVDDFLAEAKKWDRWNLGWIEDPRRMDDLPGLRKLSSHLGTPVAAGDERSGLPGFQRLMDDGKIQVVRLDATVCGGIRTFQSIAKAAFERGLPVSCHVFHYLHAQLAAAVPGVKWVEFIPSELDLESIHLLWHSDLTPVKGHFVIPDRPGVGYEWNEEAIAKYRSTSNGHRG